jgi:hypothetical protein
MLKRILHYLLLAALLMGVPFLCAELAGRTEILEHLSDFPPRTEDWGFDPSKLWNMRKPFTWLVFLPMLAGILAVLFPFARRALSAKGRTTAPRQPGRHSFPWWGWAGLALMAVAWVLAWNRFPWFAPFQFNTFLPLWIAYILVVNALCVKRCGACLMTRHPLAYLATFPVSALFWWFFEYLNRYVWNWYYQGVEGMSAGKYAFFATCSFATVLPAVSATAAWLNTFPAFSDDRFCHMARVPFRSAGVAASLAALALAGLSGIVFKPEWAFPLLWISPLCVFLLLQILMKEKSVADELADGDGRLIVRFALAALICGFFWETWNFHSLAKWVYAVPYVHAFQYCEMPAIGFAGYLPFGLECAAVTAWILPDLVQPPR